MLVRSKLRRGARTIRFGAIPLLGAILISSLTSSPALLANSQERSGKTVAHRAGGKAITTASVLRRPPKAHIFRIEHGAGEPTLGITKKGTVYITASDGCVTSCTGSTEMTDTVAPGGRSVFASKDKGKTWVDVSPRAGPVQSQVFSMDPYLYVDDVDESTDRIFDVDLTVACALLSYSDDEGKSWITNPAACGEPINDHQTVFSGPPVSSPTIGYPKVVYYCFNHPAFTKCSKSLNGGLTFQTTANIEPPRCSGLNGHGVTNSKGVVYIPLGENCGQPNIAISKDEGDTWNVVQVSPLRNAGGDPSVAVDSKGNLYYLFVEAESRLPYLTISRNGGKTWSRAVSVAPHGVKATNLATLDAGKPGKVAIAYYGTNGKGKVLHWSGYLAEGFGVLGKHPVFYTSTINDPRHPLKVDACGPGRCGRVLDFIDVEISPRGVPWGAFVDACLKTCEKANEENIHDNQAVVGSLTGGPRLR